MWSPALRRGPSAGFTWRRSRNATPWLRPHDPAGTMPLTRHDTPRLAPGERTLLSVRDAGGAPVLATDRALYRRSESEGGWHRWGWEQVGQVAWDRATGRLTLTGHLPGVPRRAVLRIHDSTALPDLARERVTHTTLAAAQAPLDEHRTALVTARRRPGSDEVTWAVIVSPDVDPDDPGVAEAVDAAISALRADLGL